MRNSMSLGVLIVGLFMFCLTLTVPIRTVHAEDFGCTDPGALNYNPIADTDDGSCIYPTPILGCIDPAANNYDPTADTDDGSCTYDTPGQVINISAVPHDQSVFVDWGVATTGSEISTYRITDANTGTTLGTSTTRYFTITGLVNGQARSIKIRGENAGGVGSYSNPVTISSASTPWAPVGPADFSAGQSLHHAMAMNSNNVPYVAYADVANGARLTVMKFDGTQWVAVGTPGFSVSTATEIDIAINHLGVPYVSYRDWQTPSIRASVMKFDGTNWVYVGVPGFTDGGVSWTKLAFDSHNTPYIAYYDGDHNNKATVMKFDGTNWVYVGTPGFSPHFAYTPSLVISPNDTVYLAYWDIANNQKASVMKFDGTNWVYVGTPGFTSGIAPETSLAIDSAGVLYVAYHDWDHAYRTTVMKFDGTNWTIVGIPGFSQGRSENISMMIGAGNVPYVGYSDCRDSMGCLANVKKFNGTNWITIGTADFSAGHTEYSDFVLDSNNNPYVVFEDSLHGNKATVMRLGTIPYVGINHDAQGYDRANLPPWITGVQHNNGGGPIFGSSKPGPLGHVTKPILNIKEESQSGLTATKTVQMISDKKSGITEIMKR